MTSAIIFAEVSAFLHFRAKGECICCSVLPSCYYAPLYSHVRLIGGHGLGRHDIKAIWRFSQTPVGQILKDMAIGGLPLAAGIAAGNTILTVAVLAILIAAPLGAIGIDAAYKKMLTAGEDNVLGCS